MSGGQDEDEGMPLNPWLAQAAADARAAADAPADSVAIEERVRQLYGRVLSEDEVMAFAAFEQDRPHWHCWPHVGWPEVHIIYARREMSAMNVIMAENMADLGTRVDEWITAHSHSWER